MVRIKKLAISLALVATALLTLWVGVWFVDPAFAQATTKSLATNFTLINFGASPATVSVAYYKPDGSTWTADAANTNFTIPANGGQKIIRQYSPYESTLTPGQGSAIVSSDQQLGAVAQIRSDYPGNPGQNASDGAYSGVSTAADNWLLPLVAKNGSSASGTANSQIIIQNAGASAVTVNVVFSNGYTKAGIVINPGASNNYDLTLDGSLAAGFHSAVVTTVPAGGQIVVVVNTFYGADGLQTMNAFPANAVSSAWVVPLFVSRLAVNNLNTPVTVQNLSGGSLAIGQIQMACVADPASPTPGNFTVSNTTAVANNASYSLNPVVAGWTGPVNWVGACRVATSPAANTVTFVQMRFVGIANADSYQAINAASTNKKVFVPLVAKRLSNGFATNVTIVNVSNSQPANVTLTYTKDATSPGPAILSTVTSIPAGGSLQQNQRLAGFTVGGTAMPDGWIGTLTVTSADRPIDGFVQLTFYTNPPGDTFMTHNVFATP